MINYLNQSQNEIISDDSQPILDEDEYSYNIRHDSTEKKSMVSNFTKQDNEEEDSFILSEVVFENKKFYNQRDIKN